jgi:hypothetical protein
LYVWSGGAAAAPVLPEPACLASAGSSSRMMTQMILPGDIAVAAAPYKRGGSVDEWVGVAVTYASDGVVYGASACVDVNGGTASVNDPTCGALGVDNGEDLATEREERRGSRDKQYEQDAPPAAPLPLWVGAAPSIALLPLAATSPLAGGALAVLSVNGEGYCANAEAHNKNAFVGLCDQVPSKGSGGAYLNYAYGSLGAWTAALLSSKPFAAGGPCTEGLAAGMFAMGSDPSAVLFEGDAGDVQVGVAYEGLGAGAADPLACGVALAAEGAVKVAGWPVAAAVFEV